jgi:hypothetical protein
MSWLNWFSRDKKKPHSASGGASFVSAAGSHSDVKRTGPSRDAAQPAAQASAQRLEQRRTERNAKRELLFQVVRESMVRVGVLSSAFRFKVLSLDQRGRSFLVMIELSSEFSGEAEKLAEIESLIAQTARHRFDIMVQAVYWRYFSVTSTTSAATSAPAPLLGAMHAPISRPAPLFAMDSSPSPAARVAASQGIAAASTASAILPAAPSAPANHDELSEEEVAAFRRALAAGAAQGAMAAPPAPVMSAKKDPVAKPNTLDQARSKLLLTGYEDTEMADDDPMPALSGTQYGELR